MKFLRKVFTSDLITLISVLLGIFGVGMGLLIWHDGQLFWGILYAAGGVAVFIFGRIVAGKSEPPDDPRGRPKWR